METTKVELSRGQAKGVRNRLAARRHDAGIMATTRGERREQRLLVLSGLGLAGFGVGVNPDAFQRFCAICGSKTTWKDGRCSVLHRSVEPVVTRPRVTPQPVMNVREWCGGCQSFTERAYSGGPCLEH